MFIIRARNAVAGWYTWHTSLSGPTYGLSLQTSDAQGILSSGTATLTNTTFTAVAGGSGLANLNATGTTYVAYCWAAVPGYSAFGSFTGNASTDGPFIYTGFRPRFLMIKSIGAISDWLVYDTTRNAANLTNLALVPDTAAAEVTAATYVFDLLSNGFKSRGSNPPSGEVWLYAAFAENPLKYANAR
jgi:hypothetical protein